MFFFTSPKFTFASDAFKATAFSPFQEHINDIENKRSRLFPDRRRIPGRKTKYIFMACFLIHAFYIVKLIQQKMIYGKKAEQQISLQRKVAPLMQSKIDIQYTTAKHRWDLMAKEVLGQDFVKKSIFHNRDITWIPMNRDFYGWARSGLDRYGTSKNQYLSRNFINGFETQNI